MKWKD
jgi:centrosomal protein CEP76